VSISDPDSGFGGPESQSDSGSGCSHHKRLKSAVQTSDTLPLGRPLKGILKNNQCSTLPRQNCSCSYLGEVLPEPPELPDNVPDNLYDIDNVPDNLYDIDNVPENLYDIDTCLPRVPPPMMRTLSQLSQDTCHVTAGDDIIYYSSANISTCDASEKLSQNEVLDTVESSV